MWHCRSGVDQGMHERQEKEWVLEAISYSGKTGRSNGVIAKCERSERERESRSGPKTSTK